MINVAAAEGGRGAGGVLWFVSSYGSRLLVRVLEFSNSDIGLAKQRS